MSLKIAQHLTSLMACFLTHCVCRNRDENGWQKHVSAVDESREERRLLVSSGQPSRRKQSPVLLGHSHRPENTCVIFVYSAYHNKATQAIVCM